MKITKSFLLIGILSTLVSSSVFAQSVSNSTYGGLPLGGGLNSGNIGIGTQAEAKYAKAGTYYELTSKTLAKNQSYAIEVSNVSGASTKVTRNVTMEYFAELSVGGEVELNAMVEKTKINANATAGVKRVVSTSVEWVLEKPGKYKVSTGQKVVNTSGYIEVANTSGVVVSRKPINAKYTYHEYSDIVKL